MPWALCTWALRVIISVGASAASFCAKYRAGPWKIKKQTHMRRRNNFFLRGEGCVPVAYYPALTSAPLPLPREQGKQQRPRGRRLPAGSTQRPQGDVPRGKKGGWVASAAPCSSSQFPGYPVQAASSISFMLF